LVERQLADLEPVEDTDSTGASGPDDESDSDEAS
jgi:hypothetical protein